MADRNPLLVSSDRKSWFKRVLGRGGGSLDPAELQRMEAQLVKEARIADLRARLPHRAPALFRLEACLPLKEGEPGSRPKLTGVALRRAHRRAERRHYGRHHGRQHRIPR